MLKNNKHLIHYVPHGIDPEQYKPLDKEKKGKAFTDFYERIFGKKKYDFIIGFISRNMWRKNQTDLIVAYRSFCDDLTKEQADKCLLFLKSEPVSDAGTDLLTVKDTFAGNYNVIINNDQFDTEQINFLYNTFDMYINCSSNEGFGLGVAEAMMAGVPISATVTGGLQDQMGFVDAKGKPMEFSRDFATNIDMKYTKHGEWVYPMKPDTRHIQGSPVTPYVMEEFLDFSTIKKAIQYWYNKTPEERKKCGLAGRKWAMNEGGINAKNMANEFIKAMDFTLENFVPNKKFGMYSYTDHYNIKLLPDNNLGFNVDK